MKKKRSLAYFFSLLSLPFLSFIPFKTELVSSPTRISWCNEESSISYTLQTCPYLFSTYFEMFGMDRFEGRVIKKNFLDLRTTYDLYHSTGTFEAEGICRLFSLGTLYPWAKEIDIYDGRGEKIGFIDGRLLTTAVARYDFYNRLDQYTATAYLDGNSSGFTIESEGKIIARLKRNFIRDVVDTWSVSIYDTATLDPRIVKIFSAFALDYQNYFKEDF